MKNINEIVKNKKNHEYKVLPTLNINDMKYKNTNINEKPEYIDDILFRLQEHLTQNHKEKFVDISNESNSKFIIEEEIKNFCIDNNIEIDQKNLSATVKVLKESILDYDVLTPLIFEDEDIEEIRVNDYNDIRIVKNGNEQQTEHKFSSRERLFSVAQRLCRNNNAPVIKRDNPYSRLRIGKNIRVSIMASPVIVKTVEKDLRNVQMTIRKQKNKPLTKEMLLNKTINSYGDALLEFLIKNGASSAFFGGTNTGKTGTMAAYISRMRKNNRTISIAEIDEMNLREIGDNGKSLNATLMWEEKKKYNIDFRKLINYSLTFSPDTLVLQEIKSSEAIDVVNAAITGHQVVTTLHAHSIDVFGKRILGMYKEGGSDLSDDLVLEYVAEAFDILVRMTKFKDGTRKIMEISEILGYERKIGQFNVNVLLKYKVDDSNDNFVTGTYYSNQFISEEIQQKMLEKGASRQMLLELESHYKRHTEGS